MTLKNNTISISRAKRQGIESKPKTDASIRTIDIIDALIPYIKNHIRYKIDSSEYLLNSFFKKPYSDSVAMSRYWKLLLKRINITYRNPYQMRHTFASMMISNGEDILWVSKMLGHTTSAMTLNKYARYIENKDKKRGTFLLAS